MIGRVLRHSLCRLDDRSRYLEKVGFAQEVREFIPRFNALAERSPTALAVAWFAVGFGVMGVSFSIAHTLLSTPPHLVGPLMTAWAAFPIAERFLRYPALVALCPLSARLFPQFSNLNAAALVRQLVAPGMDTLAASSPQSKMVQWLRKLDGPINKYAAHVILVRSLVNVLLMGALGSAAVVYSDSFDNMLAKHFPRLHSRLVADAPRHGASQGGTDAPSVSPPPSSPAGLPSGAGTVSVYTDGVADSPVLQSSSATPTWPSAEPTYSFSNESSATSNPLTSSHTPNSSYRPPSLSGMTPAPSSPFPSSSSFSFSSPSEPTLMQRKLPGIVGGLYVAMLVQNLVRPLRFCVLPYCALRLPFKLKRPLN